MPVDPSISLGVNPPAAPANPLGAIGAFADVQDKLNQIQLFRQTFAARQKAGQILAASPDLDTGLQNLYKDPTTAAFAGEINNQTRQGMLAQLQYQGEQQKQSEDGFDAVMKGLSAGISEPSMVPKIIDAQTKLLSPAALERDGPAIESVKSALIDGLPSDPAAAQNEFIKRLAAFNLAANVNPDVIRAQRGTMAPQAIQTTGPGGEAQTQIIGGPAAGGSPSLGQSGASPVGASAGGPSGGNALAPGMLASGPSATREAEMKGIGDTGATIQADMANKAQNMPIQMKRLDAIIDTMNKSDGFQPGGFADLRADGAKLLQGLKNSGMAGISQPMIDSVSNGSLKNTQEFSALIGRLAIQQLSQDAKGQGRALSPEVNFTMEQIKNTQDPATILQLMNMARYQYQVQYDQSQKFMDFKQQLAKGDPAVKGLDLADFPSYYNKNFGKTPLPPTNPGGALNLGATPESAVKGAGVAEKPTTYKTKTDVVSAWRNGDFGKSDSPEAQTAAAKILREQFGMQNRPTGQ